MTAHQLKRLTVADLREVASEYGDVLRGMLGVQNAHGAVAEPVKEDVPDRRPPKPLTPEQQQYLDSKKAERDQLQAQFEKDAEEMGMADNG